MRYRLILLFVFCAAASHAQIFTKEDSLHAGLVRSNNPTVISGYGQAQVTYDAQLHTAVANVTRNVLFVGHRFNNRVSFFSEMEIENAKVVGGTPSGEISMEQLFLKFNVNRSIYLTAGLFIPRLGIINENHLPTTFNGNDRTFVETLIIPATWRELGVGIYGTVRRLPGFNYSFAIVNGLNSGGFQNGTGIANGRFEGSNASSSNIAVTGAALYYYRSFRMQASAYYGGSAGLTKRKADSLKLASGPFGTPVALLEADVQYFKNGISVKALATTLQIPNAFEINRAYANNTATSMVGAYLEAGYNVLKAFDATTQKNLTVFVRQEYVNMNQKLPSNGIYNGILKKNYTIAGITYQPVQGVSVKFDYVLRVTGDRNPNLIVTQFPQNLPYYTKNGFFNLGFGYSF